MQIRYCQGCGIKVTMKDDAQVPIPFFCELCRTKSQTIEAYKVRGEGEKEEKKVVEERKPDQAQAEASTSNPAVKKTSQCPKCFAELFIEVINTPVKTFCPACNEEIVLFPSGASAIIEPPQREKYKQVKPAEKKVVKSANPAPKNVEIKINLPGVPMKTEEPTKKRDVQPQQPRIPQKPLTKRHQPLVKKPSSQSTARLVPHYIEKKTVSWWMIVTFVVPLAFLTIAILSLAKFGWVDTLGKNIVDGYNSITKSVHGR